MGISDLEVRVYYIRYLLAPVGAFFSCLTCLVTLFAHFFYPEMRKSTYNVIAFMIIVCHLFMGAYTFIQTFNNFGYWETGYEYPSSKIYYDTFKGMVGVMFTFAMCGFYCSLCHCIVSLCQVYNARQRLGKMYIVYPIVFAFVCLVASTFILQDTGIKDYLIDGITDGSLSELLHVVIIFLLVPYVIYSIWVVYGERKKLVGQNQQQAILESGVLADRDLFTRHIKYMIIFLATVMPGCMAELLPMLWKTIPRSSVYRMAGNLAAVLFSCSGIGVSIVRLYDPYVKQKLQSAIAARFACEFLEEEGGETFHELSLTEVSQKLDDEISPQTHSSRGKASVLISPRKTIFEQDILGSLAGLCLMIDIDYDSFMSDKSFYKRISKLEKSPRGNVGEAKHTKEKRTFYGNKNFPEGFVRNTESYQNFQIEVKEYSREYMQNLRVLHKYTKADFFESLRPATNEEKLKALFDKTSGRGGYPLFSTANKKYIIKQISKYEKNTLLKTFLIPYHRHVIQNSSFICRVLGLFAIRVNGKFKIYSLIMQNIDPLPGDLVDFKYDLKMSTVNRQQLKVEEADVTRKYFLGTGPMYGEIVRTGPKSRSTKRLRMSDRIKGNLSKLKDIDFVNIHGSLPIASGQAAVWEAAQAKMVKDVRFLESINIMDYSLIITVARVRGETRSFVGPLEEEKRATPELSKLLVEEAKMPDVFAELQRNGNCLFSPSGNFAYVFGIIDILQEYDIEKKGEGGLKGVLAKFSGKSDISCQPPNAYADRFLSKLGGIFSVEGQAAERDMLELNIGGDIPRRKNE